jgi:Tol biopolymer transport system component
MLTAAGAKLLDFGLAKSSLSGVIAGVSQLTTAATPVTAQGTIVGTLQYMAPEQIEGGGGSDARTDLFAFGLLLYEMLTGRKAFDAQSHAALVAAILEYHPPAPSSLQPLTPPAMDRVVKRCLAKDPNARWQNAYDLADELRWIAGAQQSLAAVPMRETLGARRVLALLLATGLLCVVAIGIGFWQERAGSVSQPTQRSTLAVAESAIGHRAQRALAVSPDGRTIAFIGPGPSGSRLYIRRLNEWDAQPLHSTDEAQQLCFSPDSQWIAFVAGARQPTLRKVPVIGGPSQLIAPAPRAEHGIRWSADGRIVFAERGGISSVAAAGGAPHLIVQQSEHDQPVRFLWPETLPNPRAILFTTLRDGRAAIVAWSLDSHTQTVLIDSAIRPRYVPEIRHLVYQSGSQLFAVPFDVDRLALTGEPHVIADEVGDGAAFSQEYDVSGVRVLAYYPPSGVRLVWRDRAGNVVPLSLKPRRYTFVALSREGTRAVLGAEEGTARRLYFVDPNSGEPLTRLTRGDDDLFGLFTPDERVLFTSGRDGRYNIFSTRADGAGDTVRLTSDRSWEQATSISPDGTTLLFNRIDDALTQVYQMRLDQRNAAISPLITTDDADLGARFAPDGRWIAYENGEQVFVQGFPRGPRIQISVDGGAVPVWNPKGGELFFASSDAIMAVHVEHGNRIGQPVPLFPHRNPLIHDWDVTADGRRFLTTENTRVTDIRVVSNWLDELRQKVGKPAAR